MSAEKDLHWFFLAESYKKFLSTKGRRPSAKFEQEKVLANWFNSNKTIYDGERIRQSRLATFEDIILRIRRTGYRKDACEVIDNRGEQCLDFVETHFRQPSIFSQDAAEREIALWLCQEIVNNDSKRTGIRLNDDAKYLRRIEKIILISDAEIWKATQEYVEIFGVRPEEDVEDPLVKILSRWLKLQVQRHHKNRLHKKRQDELAGLKELIREVSNWKRCQRHTKYLAFIRENPPPEEGELYEWKKKMDLSLESGKLSGEWIEKINQLN